MSETKLEILWNQFHDRLGRFISSCIPTGGDAEDILQEVFLRIHTNLDTVRDIDRLESWFYQIARNSITDYYRKRRDLQELTDLPAEDEPAEVDNSERMAPYIRQVVQSLPEPYREALLLTEYEGLSQVQIAERLGISISGAKSRVQRARLKVKEIMLACCHFEFDVRGVLCCYRARCACCEDESIPVSF